MADKSSTANFGAGAWNRGHERLIHRRRGSALWRAKEECARDLAQARGHAGWAQWLHALV
jgi:hypothetical protein